MRIAIAGGSLGGLFAAALLCQDGHEVSVHERSVSGLAGRGAGLVAQEDVFAILRLLGRPEVAEAGVTARDRITLDRSGSIVHRDARSQMQISWDALHRAVRKAVPDGSYHLGSEVISAETRNGAAMLRIADGGVIDADLVIGAEGIGSPVRRSMAGAGAAEPRYAGYVAWRFLLPESHLSMLSATVLSERFAFFHMEGGQVLGYLVSGPEGDTRVGHRRYNCVWYRRVANLPALLTDTSGRAHAYSLPRGFVPDAVRKQLVADARDLLPPPFAEVVELEPQPFVQAIFDLETPTMVEGRLALLGDAAFVARPHTAMGVAKAAGDAMALASALRDLPVDAALGLYKRDRARAGRAIVQYGRTLGARLG